MSVKEITAGLPWWVTWVLIPAIVLVVFGGLIMALVGFIIGLLFKVLLAAALIAGAIFLVRQFMSTSSSGSGR
ncbi:DUF5326 family protein [Streptomyces synnematoformans]|uniref:DUF5326 family protein n=1 Tax=Streptomyces synnematoformans TaxID=415721 RepID=A0ABN1ZJA0_9ACTN